MSHQDDAEGLGSRLSAMESELAALRDENARLRRLLGLDIPRPVQANAWRPTLFSNVRNPHDRLGHVDHGSPPEAKVALFRGLFAGRADVYATRWENDRTGKTGWSPAVRGGWSKARDPDREYLPFTDEVIEAHLAGRIHAGLYPLLPGDACRLLACDFDGPGWVLDAVAYYDAARAMELPVGLERSRSGDGGHVWMFFADSVPAAAARRVGVHLLREAMTVRAELDLSSYDRLFPAQDFRPGGSFGNLIAMPLQGACRKRGTTLFLDRQTLEPFPDQWVFLSAIARLGPEEVEELARAFGELSTGPDASTYRRPATEVAPPPVIYARAEAMLAVDRIGVPPAVLSALKHLASVHNPEFYEKERLRFSTWNTPRFIRCYRETIDRLLLPRGSRQPRSLPKRAAGSRSPKRSPSLVQSTPTWCRSSPLNRKWPSTRSPSTAWGCSLRHPGQARQWSVVPLSPDGRRPPS